MACPQTGFFDFRIETKRRDRITHFFPELNVELFTLGRRDFVKEVKRITEVFNRDHKPDQNSLLFNKEGMIHLFRDLVKPRETIFQFGPIATTMAAKPEVKLSELFAYYVERQFATQEEYREAMMTRRLTQVLTTHEIIAKYHARRIGDDLYHVKFPFVHEAGVAVRAIKPLDLDKAEPTRIIEYGDRWRMRIARLREMKRFPENMLFVVRQPPRQGKKQDAAKEICQELERHGTYTVTETNQDAILEFAHAI